MIKVTFEYATVDEAIVAMAKLVGVQGPRPLVAGKEGSSVPSPAGNAASVSQPSTRRGRSDKGQARGSYKGNATTIAGAAPQTGNGESTKPAGALGSTDTGKAAEEAANPISTVPSPVPVAPAPEPAAPAAAAPVYTQKDVQEAVSKVFSTKGLPTALQVLQRFGANTYRDVLPAQYGGFIAHATFVSEGGQV